MKARNIASFYKFLHGQEPVRAAHGSRALGSLVPDGCTLARGHVVKFASATFFLSTKAKGLLEGQ